jgi:vesicle coat complex subunit
VCRTHPEQKGKYIKIILALLQSRSTAVMYECAVTLVSLSSAPTAVRAAANCFCQLLVSHSDNNVKLIVLDRLQVRSPGWWWGCVRRWQLCVDCKCLPCCLVCMQACDCRGWPPTAASPLLTTTTHCPACLLPLPALPLLLALQELKDRHRDVMKELLMDVLRALSAPNLDIRKKTLDIALDLIDARNIDEVGGLCRGGWAAVGAAVGCVGAAVVCAAICREGPSYLTTRPLTAAAALPAVSAPPCLQVVGVLKKEAMKTQSRELEKGAEYRQLLVQAIHTCAVRFPDVAASVLHLLCDFLSDTNVASALDVIFFIREIIQVRC